MINYASSHRIRISRRQVDVDAGMATTKVSTRAFADLIDVQGNYVYIVDVNRSLCGLLSQSVLLACGMYIGTLDLSRLEQYILSVYAFIEFKARSRDIGSML